MTTNIHHNHRISPPNNITLPRIIPAPVRHKRGIPITSRPSSMPIRQTHTHNDNTRMMRADEDAHDMANKYHESMMTGETRKSHGEKKNMKKNEMNGNFNPVKDKLSVDNHQQGQASQSQSVKDQTREQNHAPSRASSPTINTSSQPPQKHAHQDKPPLHAPSIETTSTEALVSPPTISSIQKQEQEHEQEHQHDKIVEEVSKPTSSSTSASASASASASTSSSASSKRARSRSRSHSRSPPRIDTYPPESMSRIHAKRILLPHLLPLSITLKSAQIVQPHTLSTLFPNIMKGWTKLLAKLLEMGMASEGNSVEVYSCGDASFSAQWKAIEAAKERVYLETFILKMDEVGTHTIELLYAAAERGCKVILMFDGGGSLGFAGLSENHPELVKLRSHPNATLVVFNPLFRLWSRKPGQEFWHRNHRKILIADHVGFGGGMNLTAQYAGPKLGINQFRDTHMRIEGPAVEHLTQVFHESVREALSRSEWRTIISEIRAAVPSDRHILQYLSRSGPSLVRSDSIRIMNQAHTEWKQYSPYIIQRAKQITHAVATSAKDIVKDVTRSWRRFWKNWRNNTKQEKETQQTQMKQTTIPTQQTSQQQQVPPKPWESDSESDSNTGSDWGEEWNTSPSHVSPRGTTPAPEEVPSETTTAPISPILPAPTPLSPSAPPVNPISEHHNVFLQIFRSNAIRNVLAIQRSVLETIKYSQTQILITNPFFLPRPRIARALIRAARRGVRISILTQGQSDTPWVRWAAIYIYHKFLQHPNIDIWEYQDRVLHAKTMTIDGIWSTIGSFNLDYFSSRKLLELNIGIVDHDTSVTLQQQFASDLQYSKQVTLDSLAKRPWYVKLGHWASYHIAHFIHYLID